MVALTATRIATLRHQQGKLVWSAWAWLGAVEVGTALVALSATHSLFVRRAPKPTPPAHRSWFDPERRRRLWSMQRRHNGEVSTDARSDDNDDNNGFGWGIDVPRARIASEGKQSGGEGDVDAGEGEEHSDWDSSIRTLVNSAKGSE